MGGFSSYYARAVANHFFRGDVESSVQSRPSELFLSLHSAAPTDVGSSADELTGGAYVRQSIAFSEPDTDLYSPATPSATPTTGEVVYLSFISNNSDIIFPALPASEISHIGIWTDKYAGRLVFSDIIVNSENQSTDLFILNNGDSFVAPQGSIKIYIQ